MFRYSTIFSLFLFFNFFVLNNTYSQLFSYTDGTFEKNGNSWVEKAKEGRIFYFQEYKKDENFYYLKYNSRGTELQIPITGGWANIKAGEYSTITRAEKDPVTGAVYNKIVGGGGAIWNKLYFLTVNSRNNNTINTNTKQVNQNFKTCVNCGKKIVFGENYFYTGAGLGINISVQMKYGVNEHDTQQYKDNWDNNFARICCSKNCSDADGRKIILRRQQEDRKNRAIDAKTPVAGSRNCDYCERRIFYKQRFFTKSSSGNVTTYEYQSNDQLKYNQAWRGEGGWESGKVIYCSKKCANESPTQ